MLSIKRSAEGGAPLAFGVASRRRRFPPRRQLAPIASAVIACVLQHAGRGPNVTFVARRLGIAPRTLERRFDEADLGSPRRLVSLVRWFSISRSVIRPPEPAEPAHALAQRVGFSSARAMRAALRRELGITPAALRSEHTLEQLVVAVQMRCRSTAAADILWDYDPDFDRTDRAPL